jgi:hypothetical protein
MHAAMYYVGHPMRTIHRPQERETITKLMKLRLNYAMQSKLNATEPALAIRLN